MTVEFCMDYTQPLIELILSGKSNHDEDLSNIEAWSLADRNIFFCKHIEFVDYC